MHDNYRKIRKISDPEPETNQQHNIMFHKKN